MSKNNKQKIVDTMRELILKKSVDKITVKEIVETAKLSRRAFYYHFEDIFALMKWGLEQEISNIVNNCSETDDLQTSLEQFVYCVKEHSSEAKRLLNSKLHIETENMIYSAVQKYFTLIYQKRTADISWSAEQKTFLLNFFSYGVAAYFTEQFMLDNDFDTKLFAKEVYNLIISREQFKQ